MTEEHTNRELADAYLHALNHGLARHGELAAYDRLRRLADRLIPDRDLSLKVVDDAGRPLVYFRSHYEAGRFAPVAEGLLDAGTEAVLPRPYLEAVAAEQAALERHPERLEIAPVVAQLEALAGRE